MRRAAPSAGLSPQLIKHFAIATVLITALLALFASGEDWGAQAQLEAVDAKNRLAATQAEKLGTKKIEAKLKIRNSDGGSMASGGDGGGGGGGSLYPDGPPPQPTAQSPLPPGSSAAARNEFGRSVERTPGAPAAGPPKANPKRPPSEEEIEAMLEASRQRSGGDGSDD